MCYMGGPNGGNKLKQNNMEKIYDWNYIAKKLCDEYGECIIDEGEEENPHDRWLQDVTVGDIIEFFKENLGQNEIIYTEPLNR